MGGIWQFIGGVSGALSIMAGAYGAHGLSKLPLPPPSSEAATDAARPLTPEVRKDVWQRAVSYQQLHSVTLLLVPLLTPAQSLTRTIAGASFSTGILCFSGGCYGYALTGDKRASSAAPFGGTAFILGWLALAFAATRRGGAASMLKGK